MLPGTLFHSSLTSPVVPFIFLSHTQAVCHSLTVWHLSLVFHPHVPVEFWASPKSLTVSVCYTLWTTPKKLAGTVSSFWQQGIDVSVMSGELMDIHSCSLCSKASHSKPCPSLPGLSWDSGAPLGSPAGPSRIKTACIIS